MRLELGKQARCADGAVRELADVVIDASGNRVTHLVVQPAKNPDAARLVPMELAKDGGDGHEISLRCTAQALDQLEPVREHAYLRPGELTEEEPGWDVGVEDMQPTPPYAPTGFGDYGGDLSLDVGVTYDRVPKGEIELRHASAIYSADRHHVGRVDGLVVDGDDRITHLVLERGHLWWKREIAIPAEAISKFETDMVTLKVTKDEVERLPSERGA